MIQNLYIFISEPENDFKKFNNTELANSKQHLVRNKWFSINWTMWDKPNTPTYKNNVSYTAGDW